MNATTPWAVLNAGSTLMNAGVLGFLAWHDDDRRLGWWSAAWAFATVSLFLSANVDLDAPSVAAAVAFGLFNVASGLAFLKGAYALVQRRLPRVWLVIASFCICTAIALAIVQGIASAGIPLVLLYSSGVLATGLVVIKRAGAWITGVSMCLVALHILDYPAPRKGHRTRACYRSQRSGTAPGKRRRGVRQEPGNDIHREVAVAGAKGTRSGKIRPVAGGATDGPLFTTSTESVTGL